MIKLKLVAAVAAAWIASSAFANAAVIKIDHIYYNASQCEQARQTGWPSTACVLLN